MTIIITKWKLPIILVPVCRLHPQQHLLTITPILMFMESWKQDPYTTEHFEELIIIWHWAAGLVLYRVVPFAMNGGL